MSEASELYGRSICAFVHEKEALAKEMQTLIDEALARRQAFMDEMAIISKKQEAVILKMAMADESIAKLAGLFQSEA